MRLPEGPLQFGARAPGLDYRDRPAAFGVVVREGRIATVRITRNDRAPYLDLPGGARSIPARTTRRRWCANSARRPG